MTVTASLFEIPYFAVEQPEELVTRWAFSTGRSKVGLINSDVLDGLKLLPEGSFNVAITSPPYYWARDYNVDGQIGHEDSVDEYVEKLADVFDEVKRVLHPEGVLFLNLGDTYYSGNGQPHGKDPRSPSRNFMRSKLRAVDKSGWTIPKKSLIGVPWRVALALQSRGWTLRSDIIWNRGNAFAEPTALDRPYRQHEHIFLFSKTRFYSLDRTALIEEDVWTIPIDRAKLIEHSAPFPAALVKRCVEAGSPVGGHVLDPFVGSGTTLEVCLDLERNCVGIELNPDYAREMVTHLSWKRCGPLAWGTLEDKLRKLPPSWSQWRGNKNNFKKSKNNGKVFHD
jgi:DNA modification methylase